MAQQADGTVYINTLLDTTGFKAGGKDVEAAVRRMSKTVSGIGETAKIALQKQTDAFVKSNQAYARQERKVESLKKKLREMSEQRVATNEFSELGKLIDSDRAKLNRLEAAQEKFLATGGKTNSSAYRKREMDIEELRNSIKNARKEQQQLLESGGAYKSVDTSATEQQLADAAQRLQQMDNSLATSFLALFEKAKQYGAEVSFAMREGSQLADEQRQTVGFLESTLNGLKMAAHAPVSAVKSLGRAIIGLPRKSLDLVADGLKKAGDAAKSAAKSIGGSLLSGAK